jgi:hypothetical protein
MRKIAITMHALTRAMMRLVTLKPVTIDTKQRATEKPTDHGADDAK